MKKNDSIESTRLPVLQAPDLFVHMIGGHSATGKLKHVALPV